MNNRFLIKTPYSRGREQFFASVFFRLVTILNVTASSCRHVIIASCVPTLDGAGVLTWHSRGTGIKYLFQVFSWRGRGSHRRPGDILKAILSYAERMLCDDGIVITVCVLSTKSSSSSSHGIIRQKRSGTFGGETRLPGLQLLLSSSTLVAGLLLLFVRLLTTTNFHSRNHSSFFFFLGIF